MNHKELSLMEIQQESLKILIKIHEICRKENLTYYLAYGSLIGAIRNNGIIPWDDDIDIMMPRTDYDKLEAYFCKHKEELAPLQMFGPKLDERYPYMINRISNHDYVIDTENEENYGLGIFIDIYPLDALGNTLKEAEKRKSKSCKLASLCFLSTRLTFTKGNTKSPLKLLLKLPAFCISKIMGKKHYFNALERIAKEKRYSDADYVGCVVWASDDGNKGVFEKKWLGTGKLHRFEEHEFCIPDDYDSILKKLYGDYMAPPPESEQIAHHFYKAYRRY